MGMFKWFPFVIKVFGYTLVVIWLWHLIGRI